MLFPKISIVTVTVQPIRDLEKTTKSILAQEGSKFSLEWIIVAGKHFEEYEDFVESLPNSIDIKLLYQEPNGIYSAMNFGMNNSSGDWVWFLNCGDYLVDQTVLSIVGDVIYQNPTISLIASPVLYATPHGDWFDISLPRIVDAPSGIEAHFHHQGVLVKKIVANQVDGGFDTNLKFAADGKFLDQAASLANILIIKKILAIFVMGGASSKNFQNVVQETRLYRVTTKLKISTLLKNWCRETILILLSRKYLSYIIRPLVLIRDWKVKKRFKTYEI